MIKKNQVPVSSLTPPRPGNQPQPRLSLPDAVALIVGIVVGAGIFRTPSLVAANSGSPVMFAGLWVVGGLVSLAGALCYAELCTTFPHTGGDYHFLTRAYGKRLAFLFAWARLSIIQTGSIALLAFIVGDYLSQVYPIGAHSAVTYAALAVILLTALNIMGLRFGAGAQKLLTVVEVSGILLIAIAGFLFAPGQERDAAAEVAGASVANPGLALVFVLLTFGGWNEAAYLSAELRAGRRDMVKALILGLLIITAIYLLVNLSFLHGLGLEKMARSQAVAGDLMRLSFGEAGVVLIGILVSVSALTSANATILTGARTNFALGRDYPFFRFLGQWNSRSGAPVNALLVQGGISLALLSLGLFTRKGFETMIDYTAPVFWFFFLLVGLALFVLRYREPDLERPFRVPLYPFTPLVFCFSSAYLLYASLRYTGLGALVGIGVLAAGGLVLLVLSLQQRHQPQAHPLQKEIPEN